MKEDKFPPGWNTERVQQVLAHYEEQTEEEAVTEDEATFEDRFNRSCQPSYCRLNCFQPNILAKLGKFALAGLLTVPARWLGCAYVRRRRPQPEGEHATKNCQRYGCQKSFWRRLA